MTMIHEESPGAITHSDGPMDERRQQARDFTTHCADMCAGVFPRSYLAMFLFTPVDHDGQPNVAIDYFGNVPWPHLRDLLLDAIALHDRTHAQHEAMKGEAQGNG